MSTLLPLGGDLLFIYLKVCLECLLAYCGLHLFVFTFTCSITLSLIHQTGKNHVLKYKDIWRWRLERTRLSVMKNKTSLHTWTGCTTEISTITTANHPLFSQLIPATPSLLTLICPFATWWISLPCGINVSFSGIKGRVWSNKTFREMYSNGFLKVCGSSIVLNALCWTPCHYPICTRNSCTHITSAHAPRYDLTDFI